MAALIAWRGACSMALGTPKSAITQPPMYLSTTPP
jgi:hypothetical protein